MWNSVFDWLRHFYKPTASTKQTGKSSSQAIGDWAEICARDYLLNKGLKLRDCNYRCKAGEIDLIMLDRESLVFVEVRSRGNDDYGSALESVNHTKQQRLVRAAKHYLQKKRLTDKLPCRFDVISVDRSAQAHWIRDAFSANG